MDKKIIYAIISILILSLLLGCADDKTISPTKKTFTKNTEPADTTPESVLREEIRDGKLVEVYDEFVRVDSGQTKDNWMIINNVKSTAQEFRIIPCSMCVFDSTKVKIGAGDNKIVKFQIKAEPGKEPIRVKDDLNNAYGYVDVSVIVE